MAAASSSSTGTFNTKPYSGQIVNGRFTATYSNIKAHSELIRPQSLQIMKAGTAITALISPKFDLWPLDWDAMPGGNGAVRGATQAVANDAVRPSPAGQMSK